MSDFLGDTPKINLIFILCRYKKTQAHVNTALKNWNFYLP